MQGYCNCREVSFRVLSKITKLYQCHCQLCQKQSGSTSNTAAIVGEEAFVWLKGQEKITHWQKPSGFTSDFCSDCGSPVPNKLRGLPYVWIPMGLIESSDIYPKIHTHLCCSDRAQWDELVTTETSLDGMPSDIHDFIHRLST
jgi:hypothetical protein